MSKNSPYKVSECLKTPLKRINQLFEIKYKLFCKIVVTKLMITQENDLKFLRQRLAEPSRYWGRKNRLLFQQPAGTLQ